MLTTSVATWRRCMETSSVDVLDGHNPKQAGELWLAMQFARLAVFALTFGLVAVPVTCVDAHGPHSLYAPPDVQAFLPAVTLSTNHHHQHGDEMTRTSGDQPVRVVPSSPDEGRPVVNTVGMAQLSAGELVATTPEAIAEPQGQGTRLLIAEPNVAQAIASVHPELPPPR